MLPLVGDLTCGDGLAALSLVESDTVDFTEDHQMTTVIYNIVYTIIVTLASVRFHHLLINQYKSSYIIII